MYKYILFDLDGTLTDSKEGVCKSVQHALAKMNRPVPPIDELDCFIGPPLSYSFVKYSGLTPEEAEEAISIYRERYSTVGKYENRPYDGISELLAALKADGRILSVASSKPEPYVRDILKHFDIEKYFDVVSGADFAGLKGEKEDVMAEALKQMGIVTDEDKKDVVMIGDRHYDINGAHFFKLDSIGTDYGYAPEGELKEAGATYVVATVEELRKLLMEA